MCVPSRMSCRTTSRTVGTAIPICFCDHKQPLGSKKPTRAKLLAAAHVDRSITLPEQQRARQDVVGSVFVGTLMTSLHSSMVSGAERMWNSRSTPAMTSNLSENLVCRSGHDGCGRETKLRGRSRCPWEIQLCCQLLAGIHASRVVPQLVYSQTPFIEPPPKPPPSSAGGAALSVFKPANTSKLIQTYHGSHRLGVKMGAACVLANSKPYRR